MVSAGIFEYEFGYRILLVENHYLRLRERQNMKMRCEVFMGVKTEIMGYWVISLVDDYQYFGGNCCICPPEDRDSRFSEILVTTCEPTQCHNPEDH
jgi:hypothetical protein